ncbi:MAG TPA: YCF48-related protein [Ignavibacteria bacterium]
MKKIIFTLVCITFITTISGYSQWTVYQTNTTMQLNKIQFVNENTGFAAGGGPFSDSAVFYKTINAGLNWNKFKIFDSVAYPLDEVYGLFFLNANTGFVSGRYLYIYKTTNGGANWKGYEPPYYSLTQIYNALYFIDENTGYAAGRYGYFCKTTNGGLNWILTADLPSNLFGVYFTSLNTGYVCAQDGAVYKTTNGGYNFVQTYIGPYSFGSIRFISENIGFVAGSDAWYYSGIYRTTNSGSNWVNILECNYELYDVFFIDANTGFSSGYQTFLKTTNSGQNWLTYSAPFQGLSMYFFNSSNGYVSGGGGKIHKTTTGGVWINQISSEIPESFEINKCYPNPFNSELKVELAVNKILYKNPETYLEIFDTKGTVIFKKQLQINSPGFYEVKLDFGNLSSGIYFIRARNDNLFTQIIKVIFIK